MWPHCMFKVVLHNRKSCIQLIQDSDSHASLDHMDVWSILIDLKYLNKYVEDMRG